MCQSPSERHPLTDIAAAELQSKVGGKVQPVTTPDVRKILLRMALIVAGGTGEVQYPAARFAQSAPVAVMKIRASYYERGLRGVVHSKETIELSS